MLRDYNNAQSGLLVKTLDISMNKDTYLESSHLSFLLQVIWADGCLYVLYIYKCVCVSNKWKF